MAEAVAKLPVKTEKAQRAALPEWRPFESLRREMDRLFDSFDSGFWRSPFGRFRFRCRAVLASRIDLDRRAGCRRCGEREGV